MGKKSIHFGGGNIGRGFVAEFLHESGYEVVFVDVIDSLIETLQKTPSYEVTEIGPEGEKKFTIDNFRAINSKHEMDKVIHEIATADTVTCAVGPNILKFIAEPIAKGIEARKESNPIAVIACENAIGATDTLRGFIEQKLSDETKANIKDKARFANSAIDRIVPLQDEGMGMNVKIEKFYEWCVESAPFKPSEPPAIKGVHYVEDLQPYIERKLYTVNTGHATAAYYGYNKGKTYIHEVLEDKELHDIVQNTLKETAHLICTKFTHISKSEQEEYVQAIVKRISNPVLKDVVERVGRAPLRKLSRKERFIGPAAMLAENGEKVDCLMGGVEMALRFQNVEGDEESAELAKKMKEMSATEATKSLTGLEENHPLFKRVEEAVAKVQKEKLFGNTLVRLSLRGRQPEVQPTAPPPPNINDLAGRGPWRRAARMAIDWVPHPEAQNLAKAEKGFYPVRIPVAHWQLRHYISTPEPDLLYFASGHDIFCLNTSTKKRKHIASIPFEARCTASGFGYVCIGGEERGHFAAIKLDGSAGRGSMDVDTALPLDSWRQAQQHTHDGGRRAASVNVQRIGEDIVNSISIHRIQDEEAHLDDIVAVLTNNDRTVRVYSLPSSTETACLELPFFMNHATVSPDGQTLVAVGDVNLAYFFTREIVQQPPQIHKPHNRLTSASIKWTLTNVVSLHFSEQASTMCYFTTAWSPSGQLVAVGSEGGYITVLDIDFLKDSDVDDSDAVVAVVPGSRPDLTNPHPGAIRTMMFSPEPWDLLVWAEDQGRICIGDLRTGLKSRQVISLEPRDEKLRRMAYEDVPSEDVMSMGSHPSGLALDLRELDELERDLIRRYRQGEDTAYESLDARRRHRQQRVDLASARSQMQAERDARQQAALLDDPRGLTAREQQVLDNLRTARQQEEARSQNGGQPRGVNYTSADMFRDTPSTRSGATSTEAGDPSTRPISEILSSVQDSFPELSRTNAASPGPRPRSSHGPDTPDSLPSLESMSNSGRGSGASQWAATTNSLVRLSDGSRLPRRRASVVLSPPATDSPSSSTSRGPAADAAAAAAEEDQNPWRTIEEHMSLARGPLFENARSRLQEGAARASPPTGIRDYSSPSSMRPTESDLQTELAAERARARSLARQRDRLRSLGDARDSGLAGATLGPNAGAAARAFPGGFTQGNEILLRRVQLQQMQQLRNGFGREVGVRTAGLAMSPDGRTLWAACEDGIFEVDIGVKARMFWPAIDPR
ncbi:uncharacterized protein LTR77_010868 [Saxophila tyrrhenica]|uniref:Mannitol-1-phosphate 5-dehydrogenase n=1 Tax=Saxophila tyrrhenica TaxID=1690608 RepID=A0AAV9NUD1_9PEZI|nr:hypothetical protein LTR77_010868 [Saxophila tyrrhenica]